MKLRRHCREHMVMILPGPSGQWLSCAVWNFGMFKFVRASGFKLASSCYTGSYNTLVVLLLLSNTLGSIKSPLRMCEEDDLGTRLPGNIAWSNEMGTDDRTKGEVYCPSVIYQTALLTCLYLVSGTPNAGISNFRKTKLCIWKSTRLRQTRGKSLEEGRSQKSDHQFQSCDVWFDFQCHDKCWLFYCLSMQSCKIYDKHKLYLTF